MERISSVTLSYFSEYSTPDESFLVYYRRIREEIHQINIKTDRSHEQVSDLFTMIPLSHARSQSNLEHGVTLMDLLHPVEDLLHFFGVQDAVL